MCSIKNLGSKHLLSELSKAYIVHAKETQKFLVELLGSKIVRNYLYELVISESMIFRYS